MNAGTADRGRRKEMSGFAWRKCESGTMRRHILYRRVQRATEAASASRGESCVVSERVVAGVCDHAGYDGRNPRFPLIVSLLCYDLRIRRVMLTEEGGDSVTGILLTLRTREMKHPTEGHWGGDPAPLRRGDWSHLKGSLSSHTRTMGIPTRTPPV